MSKRQKQTAILLVTCVILAPLLFVAYLVSASYYYQVIRAPVFLFDGAYRELITLTNLSPTGVMYRAGLREGDILDTGKWGSSLTDYYRLIESNRGKEIELHVIGNVRDYVSPEKFSRTVRLNVPQ